MLHEWDGPQARYGFIKSDPLVRQGHLFECQHCGEMRRETDFTADEWPLQEGGPSLRRGEPLPKECVGFTGGRQSRNSNPQPVRRQHND